MSTEWRDLENSLADLGGDVSGAELPGPDAARTRARQRIRRRTASVALAVTVVLAGGGLAVGQLAGTDSVDVQPAAPSDGSPTPTEPAPTTPPDQGEPTQGNGEPTEGSDVESELPVAFLDPDELTPMIDPADGSDVAWGGSDDPLPDHGLETCGTFDFNLGGERRWYVPERDVPGVGFAQEDPDSARWNGATQLAYRPGDPEEAFDVLRGTYQECAESAGNDVAVGEVAGYVDAPAMGIGDDAYIVGLLIETEDEQYGRAMLVGIARTGSYVTTVIRQHATHEIGPLSGREAIMPMADDLAAAVNKLCELEDAGACATDPVFADPGAGDPASGAGQPGYLTPDDAAAILDSSGIWEISAEGEDIGDNGYEHVCFAGLVPGEPAVTYFSMRVLGASAPDPDRFVGENVLSYTDASSAAEAAAEIAAGFDNCPPEDSPITPISSSIWELAWIDAEGDDQPQWYGVVQEGDRVGVIEIRMLADDAVEAEQVVEFVDIAADRLTEFGD